MAKKFLALDIGAANLALAEYELGAHGALTLVNYGVVPLAAPLDAGNADTILSPALLSIVREKGIKPGAVALSISGQMVFPRFAAIAAAGGDDKFEQMVRYEIEQNVPFPIDDMVCDRQVLGDTPSGEKSVMIVAAKLDQVEAIVAAVEAAGFRVTLVDAAPIALTNAVTAVAGTEDCSVILDIGAKTSSLVIVEGDKLYNRSIPIAGFNITRDVAGVLGCSIEEAEQIKVEKGYVSLGGVTEDEDETADKISKCCRAVLSRLQSEITRSINFYRSQQGGSAPTRLYLTGGTSLLPQIDQFFADGLGLETVFFDPSELVTVAPALDADEFAADAAILASTAGLAVHVANAAVFQINLIPPSVLAARAERAKVPVLAAAGVLFMAALALVLLTVRHQNEVVRAVEESITVKADALRRMDGQIKTAQQEVTAVKAEADKFRARLLSRSTSVRALAAVCRALSPQINKNEGLWIEKWEPGKVTIRGWSDRVKDLVNRDAQKNSGKQRTASEIVVERLKSNPSVDPESVKISDMSTLGRNDEVEQFTVEMKFK